MTQAANKRLLLFFPRCRLTAGSLRVTVTVRLTVTASGPLLTCVINC